MGHLVYTHIHDAQVVGIIITSGLVVGSSQQVVLAGHLAPALKCKASLLKSLEAERAYSRTAAALR